MMVKLCNGRVERIAEVLSGLAPPSLADKGSVGYRAASHSRADEEDRGYD
jgi:hypothetical protein